MTVRNLSMRSTLTLVGSSVRVLTALDSMDETSIESLQLVVNDGKVVGVQVVVLYSSDSGRY
eukprot:COSAG02_NODE_28648_length_585_cov_1.271605_1_plen_61_part_10